jgi:hypothetical protein
MIKNKETKITVYCAVLVPLSKSCHQAIIQSPPVSVMVVVSVPGVTYVLYVFDELHGSEAGTVPPLILLNSFLSSALNLSGSNRSSLFFMLFSLNG